jgi:hypothetical protein
VVVVLVEEEEEEEEEEETAEGTEGQAVQVRRRSCVRACLRLASRFGVVEEHGGHRLGGRQ